MIKVIFYESNLKFIDENKYVSQNILEENLVKIKELDINNFQLLNETLATMLVKKSGDLLNCNYVCALINSSKLYYYVNSIDYSLGGGVIEMQLSLDIWHSYITDFWNQESIDKTQVLNIIQANVRKDIANKTTYLYDNPYMLQVPQELMHMQKIPKINYDMEPIDKYEFKNSSGTKNLTIWTNNFEGTGFYSGKEWLHLGLMDYTNDHLETQQLFISMEKSEYLNLAFINTNKLEFVPKTGEEKNVVICPVKKTDTSTVFYFEKDDGNNIAYNFKKNLKFPSWDDLTQISKENLISIIEIPFPTNWLINCGSIEGGKYIKAGDVEFSFMDFEISNNYKFDISETSINNKLLFFCILKYLNVDSWKEFYENLIEANSYHSSLLMFYEINHHMTNNVFNQNIINLFSNDENDKPVMLWTLLSNGIDLVYDINYNIPEIFELTCGIDEGLQSGVASFLNPNIINNNPFWKNYPDYAIYNNQILTTQASLTDTWVQYKANHSWSATTGMALQKTNNWLNAGFSAAGGLAGGMMAGSPIGAMVGAAAGGIFGLGQAAIKNKQIDGHIQDIKHTPATLNGGVASNCLYKQNNYVKSQIMFLNDTDIDYANYYFTYFGNNVSKALSLNDYKLDENKECGFNYLKINNFDRVWKLVKSKVILDYFNDTFKNGVRIWGKTIDFKNN